MKRVTSWIRSFKTVKTVTECEKLGLHWKRNVFGDEINTRNCRSLWNDNYWNVYRCSELKK
jgi:hypothetical protein